MLCSFSYLTRSKLWIDRHNVNLYLQVLLYSPILDESFIAHPILANKFIWPHKVPCWKDLIGFNRKNIEYFQIRFLSINLDRKSIRMKYLFLSEMSHAPHWNSINFNQINFSPEFLWIYIIFSCTILWQKSNQVLLNMLSKIRIPFF